MDYKISCIPIRAVHLRIIKEGLLSYEIKQVFDSLADYVCEEKLPDKTSMSESAYLAFCFIAADAGLEV